MARFDIIVNMYNAEVFVRFVYVKENNMIYFYESRAAQNPKSTCY